MMVATVVVVINRGLRCRRRKGLVGDTVYACMCRSLYHAETRE